MDYSPQQLQQIALELVQGAAVHARAEIDKIHSELAAQTDESHYLAGVSLADTKSSITDPVTVIDQAVESWLKASLSAIDTDMKFLGEESAPEDMEQLHTGLQLASGEYSRSDDRISARDITWVADPIDGTVNLLYGLPLYAISLAAVVNGATVAGAVHHVMADTVYSAYVGGGAWRTQHGRTLQLRCSGKTEMATALIATGFSYDATTRREQTKILGDLIEHIRDIRRLGAAALDLCLLAEGAVDGYYERDLKIWDFAAAALVADESGAHVALPTASNTTLVAAASSSLFTQLAEKIPAS